MSLIDIMKNPPINEVIVTETGLCEANLSMKSLSIRKQVDGTVSLFVSRGDTKILFSLDREQLDHIISLLLSLKELEGK